MSKLIVTVAVTGSQPTRDMNPNLPITPQEIAESAYACFNEGASIVHVHVREPVSGVRAMDFHLYEEVVARLRAKCGMIINLTTGPGGQLVLGADNQPRLAECIMESAERRVEHVLKLRPEMCSLDIGSMNAGPFIFVNAQPVVDRMAELIREAGVAPELEIFDVGHFNIVRRMMSAGLIRARPHIQLCMGTGGGIPATPKTAQLMCESVPADATWSIFGVGRAQFSMVAMGAMLGGHVRVGMEDNIYLRKGVLTSGNAELVRHAVQIIRSLGGDVASVDEARSTLGLATPGLRAAVPA